LRRRSRIVLIRSAGAVTSISRTSSAAATVTRCDLLGLRRLGGWHRADIGGLSGQHEGLWRTFGGPRPTMMSTMSTL
jgi:hypothetical protein